MSPFLVEKFMGEALRQAHKAFAKEEVPVGAVLIQNEKVIARAHNLTRTKNDPTLHAEIVLLQKAAKALRNERILGTVLIVTLEPCAMCAGAIVQARVPVVVFGARDPKAGACGSVFKIIPNRKLNHQPVVIKDIMADESIALLRRFFREKRDKKKRHKKHGLEIFGGDMVSTVVE